MTTSDQGNSVANTFRTSFLAQAREFCAGFAELSRTSFLSMFAAFCGTLIAVAWFFSPSAMTGGLGDYVPSSFLDAEGFVTVEALRLGHTEQTNPRLVILGSSSAAQALGNPRELREVFDAHPETEDWDVAMLATPRQTRLDQLTILDTLLNNREEDDPPMVVAVGVGIHKLGSNNTRLIELDKMGRFGIRSDWADDELEGVGSEPRQRSPISLVENYKFALKRTPPAIVRLALQRPANRYVDCYSEGGVLLADERPRDLTQKQIERGLQSHTGRLLFLETLNDRLSQFDNVHLVLFDERLSPDFLVEFGYDSLSNEIYSDFDRFASDIGTEFFPIMRDAGLKPEDYHDDYHVVKGEPQKRIRAALAEKFSAFSAEIEAKSE